ncbi:MAG: hypothetical protein EON58_21150 [Alphaproteobacteria bacterium]|nr:MAG: hypothetical protein EON58_21150 [Alphaproteobacteria bacterium]
MARGLLLCTASTLLASIASPALACFPDAGPFDLDYGTRAEVIVVGRITDRERVQKDCLIPGEIIPLCVYSRIFISVEQVVAGSADKVISAIVDKHPAGGLNDGATGLVRPVPTGQVLIALEDLSVSGAGRRRRNSDGSEAPNPRWGIMTVVEKPCRSAFIFDAASDVAREFLVKWRRANRPGSPRREILQTTPSAQ